MTKQTTTAVAAPKPAAVHKSFSWLHPQARYDEHAVFYALTMDVCQGIQTCVDLAHMSHMDKDNGSKPTLDVNDTERLMRLAIVSAQMLGEIAAERVEAFNDAVLREAK